jgi:peptide/nickel transport system substrate-binding protein
MGLTGIGFILAIALVSILFLPNSSYSKPTGKLVVAMPSETDTLDPAKTANRYAHTLNCNMFESLYVRDSKAELVPALAEASEVSKDGLTYTFKLRKGVKFHDGSPFTAEDVKFSLERILDTKGLMTTYLRSIDKVEIVNDYEVIVRMKKPDGAFLKKLAFAGWIIPKNTFMKVGDEAFAKKPIGTGPFKFVRRSINEYIELEANEDHWRWVPKIKSLTYRVIPEDAVRLASLQTGDVDLVTEMPPPLLDKINSIRGTKAISHPSGAIYWVVINVKDSPKESPWLNMKVRKALNHAVDKQGIIKGILNNQAIQIPATLAPSVVPPDPSLKPYDYNPALAKKLLAEAGYPNGFKIDMYCSVGRYTLDKEISLAIANNLQAVGLDVNLHLWESLKWVTELRKKYYPLSYQEYGNTIFDPEGLMLGAIHTKAFWSFYTNPEVDKLIDESVLIYNQKERDRHFHKIDRLLYNDASHIFLWESKILLGVKEKLSWKPAPGDMYFKFWDAEWLK